MLMALHCLTKLEFGGRSSRYGTYKKGLLTFLSFYPFFFLHNYKMNVFNRLKSNSNASLKPPVAPLTEEFGPVSHEPKLTPPANFNPAIHPPLDDEQKAKVAKLLQYIESIMLPETDKYYPSERGFITENTVKRYMRARKWDYEVNEQQ